MKLEEKCVYGFWVGVLTSCITIAGSFYFGGCTTQQAKDVTTAVETGLADADKACVWLNASSSVSDIKTACNIVDVTDSIVQQAVADFTKQKGAVVKYAELSTRKKPSGDAAP